MSGLSCYIANRIGRQLDEHCERNNIGWTVAYECGYQCFSWKPKNIRRPDVSFIRVDRITPEELSQGYIKIAPDVAVEVVSPGDLVDELNDKLDEYHRAGVRLIWVVYPAIRMIDIFRADGTIRRLCDGDELSGEDVIPEFRWPRASLLPEKKALEPIPAKT